jgi:carbamoyl-phosphate synthase small subunit
VKNLLADTIEITSQNHNFAVDADSFATLGRQVRMTHVNLNDGVCEGLEVMGERCFSVQHHPEAGPGPHDSRYLFAQFDALMSGSATAGKAGV